jgi:hypothetical protein
MVLASPIITGMRGELATKKAPLRGTKADEGIGKPQPYLRILRAYYLQNPPA